MAEIYRENSAMTLRREALARVREMQRRAQLAVEQQNPPPDVNIRESGSEGNTLFSGMQQQHKTPPPNNILGQLFGQQRQSQRQNGAIPNGIADLFKRQGLSEGIGGLGETVQNTVSSVSQPLSQLLESFGIDGEKLIILLVMWAVFNNNKENKTLLMALGYLLL